MKRYVLVFLLILLGCRQNKKEIEALKAANTQLQHQLDSAEKALENITYLKAHSQVTLANTVVHEITSAYNEQLYKIKIGLPRGYEQGKKDYPVLYVIDAETNFGGISYIVQRLIKDGLIPEILVVGIAYGTSYRNFYKLRSRDLTPIEDKILKMGGRIDPTGGAPAFSDFLAFELFPFIEKNFKTSNTDRAIYGHSYGGLFGTYAFLEKYQLFNKYILLSPSLWYNNEMLLKDLDNRDFSTKPCRLYMASGELEGRIDDIQTEFINTIEKKIPPNIQLKGEVMKHETHRTIFGVGFTNGLRFVYAKASQF